MSMGITDKPLIQIAIYLKDRNQVISVRHTSPDGLTRHYLSSISPTINKGMPKGLNLGPVQFLLYVKDLPVSIITGYIAMFVDDVHHQFHEENKKLLRNKAQKGPSDTSNWCRENKLLLNKGKTKAFTFYN